MSEAPKPGDPASWAAIAQTFLDEDYENCSSYELAEIMLRYWDVRWKESPAQKTALRGPDSTDHTTLR